MQLERDPAALEQGEAVLGLGGEQFVQHVPRFGQLARIAQDGGEREADAIVGRGALVQGAAGEPPLPWATGRP